MRVEQVVCGYAPRCGASQLVNWAFGSAPLSTSTLLPCLKIISVGMLRIAKRIASAGSASVSTLIKRALPASSAAVCSKTGAKLRHGPHHGAQKSTTTGRSSPSSASKVWLVALTTLPSNSSCWQRPHFAPSCRRSSGTRFLA